MPPTLAEKHRLVKQGARFRSNSRKSAPWLCIRNCNESKQLACVAAVKARTQAGQYLVADGAGVAGRVVDALRRAD